MKIAFKSKEGRDQTLYFFSTNLSNKGVAESGFLKFCESLGTGDAFVKSASYLPHASEFVTVRELESAEPNTPPLVMVNVPPCRSS